MHIHISISIIIHTNTVLAVYIPIIPCCIMANGGTYMDTSCTKERFFNSYNTELVDPSFFRSGLQDRAINLQHVYMTLCIPGIIEEQRKKGRKFPHMHSLLLVYKCSWPCVYYLSGLPFFPSYCYMLNTCYPLYVQ